MVPLAFAKDPPALVPPKVLHKVDPRYTSEARRANIQGTVLLKALIDERGTPTQISVLSPIGFGLDERAMEAMRDWRFRPALQDGKPVASQTVVAVDFRLFHRWFDPKPEARRTSFNVAVDAIQSHRRTEETLETLKDLAQQKYAPAMYLYAKMLEAGDGVPRDPETALRLIVEAADRNYAAAMYDTGRRMMEGRHLPVDAEKGVELVRNAAVLGHRGAQFYLGVSYETGAVVPQSLDRARQYYRLCARLGEPECQTRLARLLLNRPGRQERDLIAAIAWLELAAGASLEARMILERERSALTPRQRSWAGHLKEQLLAAR